ncbi:hypothetical protein IMCC3317_21560 [Kordia antarctica]|uniref:Uncharacterized protein n=1 Tax=Kordia antarctica TaxID=1218801 RepID=A0A7L4ZKN6_9FLAO|nr:hypothetical protein [Kordia antarctica]QHI36786.1 hypothetical protein IMCC3317_21560 [Kordia antarctica]
MKKNPSDTYNSHLDKLQFAVYQQKFKTWQYATEGSQHTHSTIYANLRFYKDGTVIGVRSSGIPKVDVLDSFTQKGKWSLLNNKLQFTLKNTSQIDDAIVIYIPEEDRREMIYDEEIAKDTSLLKAGDYEGEIRGDTILVGDFIFSKLATSTLIITASNDTCEQLEAKIKNHHYVIDTFQDTGNWYTNGETGPEWFTVHVSTNTERTKEIEELVNQIMTEMGKSSSNLHWT